MNGSIYLKVKIKSLAAEARIIRLEEMRAHKRGNHALCEGLYQHRRGVVRTEARATQIAYAYLRGHAYAKVEPHTSKPIDWTKVKSMIERYGGNKFDSDAFNMWVKGTQVPIPAVAG